MEQYYYNFGIGETFTAEQMVSQFGVDPATTDIEVLNNRDFYPVQESSPDFDVALYDPTFVWVTTPLVPYGEGAIKSYTPVARPLPEAKENGSAELTAAANTELDAILCDCGINNDVVTAVASQDALDRPTRFQDVLDAMTAVTNTLDSDLTAVENATSVDEINAIVHKPYGLLNTGRGGPGQAGPRDLNLSYFTEINDLPGFTQEDLELYVPGTNTVIPYTNSLPEPFHFDSAGDCFNNNDWRLVIRYAGGGAVISTITVPQGANVDVPWVYNPVIPSSGSSSSSQK